MFGITHTTTDGNTDLYFCTDQNPNMWRMKDSWTKLVSAQSIEHVSVIDKNNWFYISNNKLYSSSNLDGELTDFVKMHKSTNGRLVGLTKAGKIYILSLLTRTLVEVDPQQAPNTDKLYKSIALSPSGDYVLVVSTNGRAYKKNLADIKPRSYPAIRVINQ